MKTKDQKIIDLLNAGRYSVTESGDVVSNSYQNSGIQQKLRPHTNKFGYMRVVLAGDGIKMSCSVHRVVALALIPNPLNLPHVNHKDCDKSNNKPSNLEWVTRKDNMKHASEMGLLATPSNAKLTKEQVIKIKIMLKNKEKIADISRLIKISRGSIQMIKENKSWRNIEIPV